MRRALLQGTGVALVALTVWAALLVGWTLWREPAGLSAGGAAPTTEGLVAVAQVLATNRLLLADRSTVVLGSITVPTAGERFAEEGRQATRALTAEGVRVEGDPQAAYVYLGDGQLLQALLVAGGYARVADDAPPDETLTVLRTAEAEAREANLGLWGAPGNTTLATLPATSEPIACEPSLVPGSVGPDAAITLMGEAVSVVFFPTQATTRNGAVTLHIGVDTEAFGVVIPAGLASTIENPGARYVSRCLAATGQMERGVDGAPRITLRSFDELQVLR